MWRTLRIIWHQKNVFKVLQRVRRIDFFIFHRQSCMRISNYETLDNDIIIGFTGKVLHDSRNTWQHIYNIHSRAIECEHIRARIWWLKWSRHSHEFDCNERQFFYFYMFRQQKYHKQTQRNAQVQMINSVMSIEIERK